MHKLITDEIKIPQWPTEDYKIIDAVRVGKLHAINHYNNANPEKDWPWGVKTWDVNPYSEHRPAAFYAWIAGFSEQWAELIRNEKPNPED